MERAEAVDSTGNLTVCIPPTTICRFFGFTPQHFSTFLVEIGAKNIIFFVFKSDNLTMRMPVALFEAAKLPAADHPIAEAASKKTNLPPYDLLRYIGNISKHKEHCLAGLVLEYQQIHLT
ncbi:hypothetical protein [Microbulbifer discodermiae]|uniref:hypothetical protein n=1 Tax=Microbulbifer sp. 2201CG32-9 TaxID=3232309 RepID=UPI00345B8914